MDQIGLRVVDPDAYVGLVEDLADLVADRVVDALHVEFGGERLLHAVDDRELRCALLALLEQALRLIEQASVFQCHAHRVGERLQQANVGVAERVFALHIGEADEPARLVSDHERHVYRRLLVLRARDRVAAVLLVSLMHVLVDDECFARAQDVRGKASLPQRVGIDLDPLPVLVDVRIVDQIRLRVVDANAEVRLIEDLADLVADRVVDPLHVEFCGERLLHAVDDGQFGGTLLLGLEQALRLVEEPRVLEGDRHRIGQRGQQAHVGVAESVLCFAIERDDADRLLAFQNGYTGVALCNVICVGITDQRRAKLLPTPQQILVDHQWLAGPDDMRGESLSTTSDRLDRETLAMLQVIRHRHHVACPIVQGDRHVLCAEYLADLVADEIDDRLEVELCSEPFLHAVDDREFRRALLALLEQPLRLVEEASVLQCDAHARGDGAQEPHFGLAVGAFARVVFQNDSAQHAVAAENRDCHSGQRPVSTRKYLHTGSQLFGDSVQYLRMAVFGELLPPVAGIPLRNIQPHAMLVLVQVANTARFGIEPANADVLGPQDLAQLVADQIDDGLEVEFRGHAFLNPVDHRQFRCALLGFLQQALRLVEEAGILEGDAEAAGKRDEQAKVRIAERVFTVDVLDRDRATRLVTDDERHPDARLAHFAATYDVRTHCSGAGWQILVDHKRLTRAHDERTEASVAEWIGIRVESSPFLHDVAVVDQIGLAVVGGDAHPLRVERVAHLVADEIEDGLDVELRGEPRLHTVDDGEFVRALLDDGIRCLQLFGAFGHLLLEALRPLRVVKRHGGLAREHAQKVAVGFAEATECAVEIGVQVTQQLALGDQRRDDAGALIEFRCAIWAVGQAHRAHTVHLQQRGRDLLQQPRRVLAARHERACQPRSFRSLQHQQHALGAG